MRFLPLTQSQTDFPAEVSGKIALVLRGTCTFALKASNAGAAGAAGVIVYNNAPEAIGGGTLGGVADFPPVVGISGDDGTAFVAELANSTVIASLWVDSVVENRTT